MDFIGIEIRFWGGKKLSHNRCYEDYVMSLILDDVSILELGSGLGQWGFKLVSEREDIRLFGIEANPKRYEKLIDYEVYYNVFNQDYTCLSIDERHFPFDYVLWLDGPEHLEKNMALDMLQKIKGWGKKIIVATPDGYMRLLPKDVELHYDEHKSSWNEYDFLGQGYHVTKIPYYNDLPGMVRRFMHLYVKLFWSMKTVNQLVATYGF